MSFSDILGIIGILLGLPGFLVLLFDGHVALAIVLILACGGVFWLRWWLNRPEFTWLQVEKIVTIKDPTGSSAVVLGCLEGVANHKGLTEIWYRNISADGSIGNFQVNGKPPHIVQKRAGDTEVCVRFPRPLERGEQFSSTLSYELTNSFQAAVEAVIHVVEIKTKKLKIVVTLPNNRPAKAARALLQYGGQTHEKLAPPRLTGQVTGERIEIEFKNPRLGAEYCVEWDW